MDFAVESLETPALTKAQLAELLFEQIGLNKRESKDMIDAFFDLISDSLVEGKDVKISGLRQFPDPHQGAASGAQSAHRRGHPDPGAARRHLPRQPQAQGADPGRHGDRRVTARDLKQTVRRASREQALHAGLLRVT